MRAGGSVQKADCASHDAMPKRSVRLLSWPRRFRIFDFDTNVLIYFLSIASMSCEANSSPPWVRIIALSRSSTDILITNRTASRSVSKCVLLQGRPNSESGSGVENQITVAGSSKSDMYPFPNSLPYSKLVVTACEGTILSLLRCLREEGCWLRKP